MLARMNRTVRMAAKEIQLLFRKPRWGPKVFCIGFNKTGTSSLGGALEMLGYDHSSFNQKVWLEYYLKGHLDKVLEYTAKFESFDDLPWLKEDMIPVLDRTFPGSKYIYLERDEVSWKGSLARWSKAKFGTSPDVDAEWKGYIRHRDFVLNYFKDRPPGDFLILDVRDPIGFRKLAEFLNRTPTQDALPHYNKS
jgi:Sulfotransferase domain